MILRCRALAWPVKTQVWRLELDDAFGNGVCAQWSDPLYNVLVFVPNGELKPFDDGVACETCEKSVNGTPLTATLTDTKNALRSKTCRLGRTFPVVIPSVASVGKSCNSVCHPVLRQHGDERGRTTAAQQQ